MRRDNNGAGNAMKYDKGYFHRMTIRCLYWNRKRSRVSKNHPTVRVRIKTPRVRVNFNPSLKVIKRRDHWLKNRADRAYSDHSWEFVKDDNQGRKVDRFIKCLKCNSQFYELNLQQCDEVIMQKALR